MRTHDPFLRAIGIVLDRLAVFTALCVLAFVLIWEAVCRYGLGLSAEQALGLALRAVSHGGDRPSVTLLVLTAAVAALSMSWVSVGLFTLWRRRAIVGAGHLRGPREE